MAIAAFDRAAQRILERLGQDAFLRGVPCGKVNIEYDIAYAGYEGDQARYRGDLSEPHDIATIHRNWRKPDGTVIANTPKTGDALVHPDGSFKLDRLIEDNGSTFRFVIVRVG